MDLIIITILCVFFIMITAGTFLEDYCEQKYRRREKNNKENIFSPPYMSIAQALQESKFIRYELHMIKDNEEICMSVGSSLNELIYEAKFLLRLFNKAIIYKYNGAMQIGCVQKQEVWALDNPYHNKSPLKIDDHHQEILPPLKG